MPWIERVPESDYHERINAFWFHVLGTDRIIGTNHPQVDGCTTCFTVNWMADPDYCPVGRKLHDQAYN